MTTDQTLGSFRVPMRPGQMRDQAIHYAIERGWYVFPVKPRGKEPLSIPGVTVNGMSDATRDPDLIKRMWRDNTFANIGIATGPSNIVVVDVDMNPWKQKVGHETWAEHVLEHGNEMCETYTARTWSGGVHYFYDDPAGEVRSTQGSANPEKSTLGRDIDTRGSGGYVVAAPSFVREDGHEGSYEIIKDVPLLLRPDWIVEALRKPDPAPRRTGAPLAAQDRVLRRVRQLADELGAAPEGEGNGTASRLAYMAGQYVGAGQIDEDEAIGILLDAIAGWQHRSPKGAEQMEKTIINQVREGTKNERAWEEPISATPQSIPTVPDPFDQQAPAPPPPDQHEGDDGKSVSMWATDNGQGVFLRDRVGNMLYAIGVGWMVWDGKRWEPVQEEFIANRVSRFYREQFEKMLEKWKAAPGDQKWMEIAKTYRSFMSSGRLKSILNSLKVTDGVLIRGDALDTHVDLLNVQNGIVDLRTGVVSPHDKKMLFTKITKARYVPGARHRDWDKARTALDTEVADYMQLRLGQAITGRTPESDDAVFLMGSGNNGKSAWASEGVFFVLGDYAALSQPTLIGKQSTGSGPSPERVGLRGVRFALIEELEEGKSLNVAEVKRVIGTPYITARNLNEKEVTFPASHTLFVTTNYTPVVAEVDEGTWRRLCRIEFPFQFVANPIGPLDRPGDAGLKTRIREGRDGQHEAILAWLVAGAKRYYEDLSSIMPSRRPGPVAAATSDWRREADRVLAYIEERLDFDPDARVAVTDLLFDFGRFLEDNNHAKWASETFLSRFRAHQTVRNAGVTWGQVRKVEGLSRPTTPGATFDSRLPALKTAPRVCRGVRFRTD